MRRLVWFKRGKPMKNHIEVLILLVVLIILGASDNINEAIKYITVTAVVIVGSLSLIYLCTSKRHD